MAIKTVNGQSVYILEPRAPTGRTTSGRSFATLYSDLRWQVWEEIQKGELAKLELEKMSAKARADIFEQASRDIRRSISNLQELKAEILAGGSTGNQAVRTAAKQAELDLKASTDSAKLGLKAAPKVKTITGRYDPISEQYLDPYVVREELEFPGGRPPGIRPVTIGAREEVAAAEAGEEARRKSSTDFLDEEIAKLEAQLAGERQFYQESAAGTDFDILGRTRRSYETGVGVMGQGGGIFGLAPRPRRELPYVDTALADERIAAFRDTVARDAAARAALPAEAEARFKEQVDNINVELEDLYTQREGIDKLSPADQTALKDRIDSLEKSKDLLFSQRIDINKGISDVLKGTPTPLAAAMGSESFRPVRGGELLLKDRRAEAAVLGIPEEEILPELPPVREEVIEAERPPRAERLPREERLRIKRPPRTEAEVMAPPPPVAGTVIAGDREGPAEMPITSAPRTADQPMILSKEQIIPDVTVLDDPMFSPAPEVVSEAEAFFRSRRGRQRRDPLAFFRTEKEMVKSYLKDQPMEAEEEIQFLPGTGVAPAEEEIQFLPGTGTIPVGKAKPSTRQRKDKYTVEVISEGIKLASQPKKLSRLAKTESATRPPHLKLVDKIYEINKGKSNGFKATYDEISRALASDPEKRKEAHSYLVAKDVLENNIKEPLA
jgi:hypothetical protein